MISNLAFEKKHCTADGVIIKINADRKSQNFKKSVLAFYCQISHAFDTVNHEIPLRKLHYYHVRGYLLECIRCYLAKGKHYVDYNGHDSEVDSINRNVPEGNVVGPLFSVIYVNHLPVSLTLDLSFF